MKHSIVQLNSEGGPRHEMLSRGQLSGKASARIDIDSAVKWQYAMKATIELPEDGLSAFEAAPRRS